MAAPDQPNREAPRDYLATLLDTRLVDEESVAGAVETGRPSTITTSPLVTVSSLGSDRERLDHSGTRGNIAYLVVMVFVAYEASGWTAANAEDRLDLIEAHIADVIAENSGEASGYWTDIDYSGRSERIDLEVGGQWYIREYIPIEVGMEYG